jgi:hypothetical protein
LTTMKDTKLFFTATAKRFGNVKTIFYLKKLSMTLKLH